MRKFYTLPGWIIGAGIYFAYKYGKYKTEAKMREKNAKAVKDAADAEASRMRKMYEAMTQDATVGEEVTEESTVEFEPVTENAEKNADESAPLETMEPPKESNEEPKAQEKAAEAPKSSADDAMKVMIDTITDAVSMLLGVKKA